MMGIEDAEYLHQLAHDDREHFLVLTGYCVPDHVVCDVCGVCIPHVSEMIFTDREGCVMDCPIWDEDETLCLATYMNINGTKAYTLFDSGSTTDAVTPDFTHVVSLTVKELAKPVTLQLGCSDSQSKVKFATVSSNQGKLN